jgi:hypothetical protein
MGTRSLLAAYIDGGYKVAQYGHRRGEPSAQGVEILKFLQDRNLGSFQAKLRQVSFVTEQYRRGIAKGNRRPFDGDHAWEVLHWIQVTPEPFVVEDYLAFAGASLNCEWAYVIDFDKGTFEVFEGFNKVPTPTESRFPSEAMGNWLSSDGEYHPVSLVKAYDFVALPSASDFIAEVGALARTRKEAAPVNIFRN